MLSVLQGDQFRFEQEVWFDQHQYGSDDPIPSGDILIQRESDSFYWDGATWVVSETRVATTISGDGKYHVYTFTFGSTVGETYRIQMRVNDDPATEILFNARIVSAASGGGGSGSITETVDVIGLTTGIPFTVEAV